MFTPPLAPGAYHEQSYWLLPSRAEPGMKYGPMRQRFASLSAASFISGV
jgi:hypothetical protein